MFKRRILQRPEYVVIINYECSVTQTGELLLKDVCNIFSSRYFSDINHHFSSYCQNYVESVKKRIAIEDSYTASCYVKDSTYR